MSTLPSFTPEENFRRIKRQKKLKFIVVEGADDVAIYESCLIAMGLAHSNYDIFFSEGKLAIEDFIVSNNAGNAMFIVDKDFNDLEVVDSRVITLNRYSIENYFICEEVVGASVQLALSCKLQDVKNYFSLDNFFKEISKSVELLLKVIFYHQNHVVKNKLRMDNPAWSETFLCEGNTWNICPNKVASLVASLAPTEECREKANIYFETNFQKSDCIIKDFPGKLLKHSLQRYLYSNLSSIKSSAGVKFGNVESMRILLSSNLYRSKDLRFILTPVLNFVNAA